MKNNSTTRKVVAKIADEIIDTTPVEKKWNRRRWSPKALAIFILEHEPAYIFMSGEAIKEKFPFLKISAKKIEGMMTKPPFEEIIGHFYNLTADRTRMSKQFRFLTEQYYRANVKLDMPHFKAVAFFGQMSGEYNPQQQINVTGMPNLSKEQEASIGKITADALNNRRNRIKGIVLDGDNSDSAGGGDGTTEN